jgi:hypothetical protein
MDRPMLMALVVVFLLILLAMMFLGWRRRQRRQGGVPRPLTLADDAPQAGLSVPAFYVATTVAREPLNRIVVAGLGYRARATVGVADDGLRLAIPGQPTILIPVAGIRSIEKATWAIDRAVEEGGLTLVRWTLGAGESAIEVDSYLRIGDPQAAARFFESAQQLHANSSQTGGHTP